MDAIGLLKQQHQEVTTLFQRFQDESGGRRAASAVGKICAQLRMHTEIEEALFYPAIRALNDSELSRLVEASIEEHQKVKDQVQALEKRRGAAGSEDDTDVAGMVESLRQDVEHHVTEEEGEMFPRLEELMGARQRSDLGRRLEQRAEALQGGTPTRRARRASSTRKRARSTGSRGRRTSGRSRTTTGKKAARARGKKRARGGRSR